MICGGLIDLADVFSLLYSTELLSAVCVNRLGWGCLRPDLWTHFAYRLSEVIYGVFEGKRRVGLWKWPTCISTGIHQIFVYSLITVADTFSIFHPISPQNDQVLQGFSVDKGEFTCPLCRQFANSVLPCRPGRGTEAGAWHAPTNKSICVLVREVEDLQERLCLFSVSEVQFNVTKTFNM